MYASQVIVDPVDPCRIYMMNFFSMSTDCGKTSRPMRQSLHGDDRFLWVNPANPLHLINADDGGGTSGKLLRGFKAEIGPGGRYDMILTGALHVQELAATYINPPGIPSARTKALRFASTASARRKRARLRSPGVVALHAGNAADAAATAASTSALPLWGTAAIFTIVDGSSTISVFPETAATDRPLITCLYVFIPPPPSWSSRDRYR
jgi:hypothetical protein